MIPSSCFGLIRVVFNSGSKFVQATTTLNNKTISNPDAVEYQWVRTMHAEGYDNDAINHYIRTCFGGDDTFADLFRRVALHKESIYVLMQYVGCAPSSREF